MDHTKEEAYRRENYILFKRNLERAFHKYNTEVVNGKTDEFLSYNEFRNFMENEGADVDEDLIKALYQEMDTNNKGEITIEKFIESQMNAFKNCEDNIEFLENDIKNFDRKIRDVQEKLAYVKQRGMQPRQYVENVVEGRVHRTELMKGSMLNFTIVEAEFDEMHYDAKAFEPMIEVKRTTTSKMTTNKEDA